MKLTLILMAVSCFAQSTDPDAVTAKLAIDSLAQRLADSTARAVKAEAIAKEVQTKATWVDTLDAKCPTCRGALDIGLAGKSGLFDGVLICCGPTTVPATKPDTSILYITPTNTRAVVLGKTAAK